LHFVETSSDMMLLLAVKLEESLLDSLCSRHVLKARVEWSLSVIAGNNAVEHPLQEEYSL